MCACKRRKSINFKKKPLYIRYIPSHVSDVRGDTFFRSSFVNARNNVNSRKRARQASLVSAGDTTRRQLSAAYGDAVVLLELRTGEQFRYD